MYKFFLIIVFLFAFSRTGVYAQKKNDSSVILNDTLNPKKMPADSAAKKDTTIKKKKHDPNKATIYSTIFPGLGQIYNKKYWKLPLVYAAVGIPVYTFIDNRKWYNKTRYALAVVANGSAGNADSLAKVDPKLIYFVEAGDATSLIKYRDEFRKNEDYSVLFFLLFYALQIVDATVDAHLKDFNVNDDLSFHVKPNIYSGNWGMSFVFDIHKAKPKALFDLK